MNEPKIEKQNMVQVLDEWCACSENKILGSRKNLVNMMHFDSSDFSNGVGDCVFRHFSLISLFAKNYRIFFRWFRCVFDESVVLFDASSLDNTKKTNIFLLIIFTWWRWRITAARWFAAAWLTRVTAIIARWARRMPFAALWLFLFAFLWTAAFFACISICAST